MPFELWVALRYLKARRSDAVLSVITAISIIGVTAGVASLVIALAITNGFRRHLEQSLLSAIPHVNLLRNDTEGIANWRELAQQLEAEPDVVAAAPAVYAQVLLSGSVRSQGAMLKGVVPEMELRAGDLLRHLSEGSIAPLAEPLVPGQAPPLVLGKELADALGVRTGDFITATSPRGRLSPIGEFPRYQRFRVVGVFGSGFFNFDAEWAFTSLEAAQRLFLLGDVASAVGLRVGDLYRAPEIAERMKQQAGPGFGATNWIDQNRTLFRALRFERTVTILIIGLIVFVAALNLFIRLYLLVVEKNRDIAVLMAMGAQIGQIRRIFQYQGLFIGVFGTLLGLATGYGLSYLGSYYKLIRLEADIYSISYVPFEVQALDGLWIGAAAVLISYVSTIYPARTAAAIDPAEALRYE